MREHTEEAGVGSKVAEGGAQRSERQDRLTRVVGSDRYYSCLSNVITFPSYKQNHDLIHGGNVPSFKDHFLAYLAI